MSSAAELLQDTSYAPLFQRLLVAVLSSSAAVSITVVLNTIHLRRNGEARLPDCPSMLQDAAMLSQLERNVLPALESIVDFSSEIAFTEGDSVYEKLKELHESL